MATAHLGFGLEMHVAINWKLSRISAGQSGVQLVVYTLITWISKVMIMRENHFHSNYESGN